MIRRPSAVLLMALLFGACEKSPAPAPTQPPEWVVEAQERAKQAEQPVSIPEPAPDLVVDRALLWTIKTADGQESALIGTFHAGTDFHGPEGLPAPAREAFQRSEVVVLEADVGLQDLEKLAPYIVLARDKSLTKMLGPERWATLTEELGEEQNLDRLQPHVVSGMLATKWVPDAGVRGMDGRFIILARAYDKRLAYLESPEEQLRVLSKVVTAKELAAMLDDVEAEKAKTVELLEAFRAGDTGKVQALTFPEDEVAKNRSFYEEVFWKRNRTWVDRLKPHLDKGAAFVAVGAGHLVGEQSLPSLLAEAGYFVEPVP